MKLVLAAMALAIAFSMIAMPVTVYAKTFNGNSYSFTYPNGCKPDKDQNKYSNSITLECKEDMLIQLNSGGISGSDITEEPLADDLLDLFSTNGGWDDVSEVERGNLTVGNTSAPFVVATYEQTYTGLFGLPSSNTEEFVAMVIAIPTNDGYVVGQYKNSAGDFDKGKSIAEKIFSSLTSKSDGINQNTNKQSSYEECQNEDQDEYENLKDDCGDRA